MSLVSFALRLVASRIIQGQTWAGDRIYNSPIDPVAQWQQDATEGSSQPCIAIYSGKRNADVVGKATQGKSARVELVFNIFVPPSVVVASPADGEEPEITLETSNTGGAMVIDFMERQIEAAFRFGPPEWRAIWDILVVSIKSIESRPLLYEIDRTAQIPCVEVRYSIDAIPDPDFGVELLPAWALLKAAMLADPDYAASAPLIDQAISAPAGLADWQIAQAALGLTDAAAISIGIKPESLLEDGDQVPVTEITFTHTGAP